jgi:transcriptional regulator with XRE-family HTH domain
MKANIVDKIRKDRELKGFTQDYLVGKLEMSERAYSKKRSTRSNLIGVELNKVQKSLM